MAVYNQDDDLTLWRLGNFGFIADDGEKYYYLKDHIGNIRVTVDESGAIISKDDYYPFGLQMEGLCYNSANTDDKLKYSGKPLDQNMGLNKYHFGWREYDPEIARWNRPDPLYFKSPGESAYNYVSNNPIMYYDIMGLVKNDVWGLKSWSNDWDDNYGPGQKEVPSQTMGGGSGGGGYGGSNYTDSDLRNMIHSAALNGDILYNSDYSVSLWYDGNMIFIDGHYPEIGEDGLYTEWDIDGYEDTQTVRPDLGSIGNQIRNSAGSNFSKYLFERYWRGKGDYRLSKAQLNHIVKTKKQKTIRNTKEIFNGVEVSAKRISFYGNSKYERAFGVATLYFNNSGEVIGFFDNYNFDAKEFRIRGLKNEVITRTVGFFGNLYNAKAFNIIYP